MTHIITPSMESLKTAMYTHARRGFYDGLNFDDPYFQRARRIHRETGTLLIFTRDVGMHSSGWFKNPDYDKCWHLSMSFLDLEGGSYRPFEFDLAETWVRCFYGENARYVWEEGNFRIDSPNVRHYRVMVNAAWQPILPRGEVYSLDLTEKGWKSWSDQRYEKQLENRLLDEKGID